MNSIMKSRTPAHQRPWSATAKTEQVLTAAIATAKFATTSPELDALPRYRVELLNNVIWLVTCAPSGKYATRYRSAASVASPQASHLRHEHVFTRKWLIDKILSNPADSVIEFVLTNLAIGCVVTKDEHDRLTPFDSTEEGWGRYLAAGIIVLDMLDGRPIDLEFLSRAEGNA